MEVCLHKDNKTIKKNTVLKHCSKSKVNENCFVLVISVIFFFAPSCDPSQPVWEAQTDTASRNGALNIKAVQNFCAPDFISSHLLDLF